MPSTEFNLSTHGLFKICEFWNQSSFIARNYLIAIPRLIICAPLPVLNSDGRVKFMGVGGDMRTADNVRRPDFIDGIL